MKSVVLILSIVCVAAVSADTAAEPPPLPAARRELKKRGLMCIPVDGGGDATVSFLRAIVFVSATALILLSSAMV